MLKITFIFSCCCRNQQYYDTLICITFCQWIKGNHRDTTAMYQLKCIPEKKNTTAMYPWRVMHSICAYQQQQTTAFCTRAHNFLLWVS